ncbi:MAG TPA: NUDIX hydrolase [Candidatus Limnocylindrales bacterium]
MTADREDRPAQAGEAGAYRPTAAEVALVRSLGRGADGRSSDRPSGLGTPDWIASSLRHCTRCGTQLVFGAVAGEERERLSCPACGLIVYVNPRLVATALPITPGGEVILLRRGIEPGRGLWAQPGGFLEVDESVSEAAIRETLEETGLIVRPEAIVGLYSRLEAAVVIVVYEAPIVGGKVRLTSEALEVRTFAPDALPWPELAFNTTYWGLRDWLARRHPDVALPEARPPE